VSASTAAFVTASTSPLRPAIGTSRLGTVGAYGAHTAALQPRNLILSDSSLTAGITLSSSPQLGHHAATRRPLVI
jgi:hypothetical protein